MAITIEYLSVKSIPENSELEKRLIKIAKSSFSDKMTPEIFRGIFSGFQRMDLHVLIKNTRDIGMMFFGYYPDTTEKGIIYLRPGVAIMPTERGGKFPRDLIIKKLIKAKLKNPFKKVFMISLTMHPIMYSTTCKYWTYTYPHPFFEYPEKVLKVKRRVVEIFKISEVAEDVVELPAPLLVDKKTKERFSTNKMGNVYLDYFTQKIGNKNWNRGLLTITPIDFKNICFVLFNAIAKR